MHVSTKDVRGIQKQQTDHLDPYTHPTSLEKKKKKQKKKKKKKKKRKVNVLGKKRNDKELTFSLVRRQEAHSRKRRTTAFDGNM